MSYKFVISKPTKNVLTETNPNNLVFSSDYGTLKYETSGTVTVTAVVNGVDKLFFGFFNHNLGHYPYVEAYVKEIDANIYKPMPLFTSGATTFITYGLQLTTTQLLFRIRMVNYAFATYSIVFKYFIFKNDLGL